MTTRAQGKLPAFQVRRIYDARRVRGGHHVLVDRLWPRGLKKDEAPIDEWLKDVAPSTDLRKWYGHDPERFAEFRRRYLRELETAPAADAAAHLLNLARKRPVVLLTATRDVEHSAAEVLLEHLRSQTGER
jgi:uncharacterized protein YeaO (DUF488 family)